MSLDLDAIEKRLRNATPIPWEIARHDWQATIVRPGSGPGRRIASVGQNCAVGHNGHNDAIFIAHAPNDIATLLVEVRELRAKVAALNDALEAVDPPCPSTA